MPRRDAPYRQTVSINQKNTFAILDEKNRRLFELIEKGKLNKYSDKLNLIIRDIYESGCLLYFREDYDIRTSHSRTVDNCYIRISLREGVYKYQEFIIWIILHEFGHHFQNNTKEDLQNKSKLYQIERDAWNFAEDKFKYYGFPNHLKENFLECRNLYLKTYE